MNGVPGPAGPDGKKGRSWRQDPIGHDIFRTLVDWMTVLERSQAHLIRAHLVQKLELRCRLLADIGHLVARLKNVRQLLG